MARPKEKTHSVFQQKCTAAVDKVRAFQTNSLISDIRRLCRDELLPDLNIIIGHRRVQLHGCILAARCPDFYDYLQTLPRSSDDSIQFDVQLQSSNLENLLGLLYSVEDVTETLRQIEECLFPASSDESLTEQTSYSSPVCNRNDSDFEVSHNFYGNHISSETIHVISENITNTSLDLVKRDSRNIARQQSNQRAEVISQSDNSGVDEKSLTDTCSSLTLNGFVRDDVNSRLYLLAEKIVQQVITEALSVVDNDHTETDLYHNGDTAGDLSIAEDIKQNSATSNDNMVAMAMCNDETNFPKKCDNQKTKCEERVPVSPKCDYTRSISSDDQKSDSKFSVSKKKSSKSLQKLAEEIYGVKTVIKACNKVGEDLLRMLLLQQNSDFVIKVSDQEFFTHRCILTARSSYFEAMLSGSWRETDENCITLEGISPSVMRQTLLYLYGGVIEIDPFCPLGGLVVMADMYGMDGLKEIIALHLNMEYCHFFHRPCPTCIAGVPDALALTLMYNINTMKDKCLKWINKNFGKVWPTKTFVSLPAEVLELSVAGAITDLALDSVLDTLIECQKLNEKTPHLKWTEPVFDMITQLMDAAIEFSSKNFISLVSGRTFRKIDKDGSAFNQQPLEDIFSMIIQALSPENACQAYLSLHKWKKTVEIREQDEVSDYSQEFSDFVNVLFKKCKEHLCTYIHQAAYTAEWDLLNKDMQKDIMQDANYVCLDTNKGRVAKPKLTSSQPKKVLSTTPMSLKEYFECHFGFSKQPEHLVSKTKTAVKPNSGIFKRGASQVTSRTKDKTTGKESGKRNPNLKQSSWTGDKKVSHITGTVVKATRVSGKKANPPANTGKTKQGTLTSVEQVNHDRVPSTESDRSTGSGDQSVHTDFDVVVSDEGGLGVDEVVNEDLCLNYDNIELVDSPAGLNFPSERLIPILYVRFNEVQ